MVTRSVPGGTVFGKGGPILAAKISPGRPILAAKIGLGDHFFAKITPWDHFEGGTDFGVTVHKGFDYSSHWGPHLGISALAKTMHDECIT